MTESGRPQPSDASAVSERKAALRRELRARRDALEDRTREQATRAIEARLAASPALDSAHVVHCYFGIGSEVATEELIRGLLMRGQRVICPRVKGQGTLDHLEVTDLDALVDGPMGLREPDVRWAEPADLAEVDVMLVPALGFDRRGSRLGYGGGYYDRAISDLRERGHATTIGLAFDMQVVDELPREAHDQPVDLIATETQMIVSAAS
jgi:5-formyltetrahydrofolate cyclo-ligase